MKKRILSMALAAIMTLCLLPSIAFAVQSISGSITENVAYDGLNPPYDRAQLNGDTTIETGVTITLTNGADINLAGYNLNNYGTISGGDIGYGSGGNVYNYGVMPTTSNDQFFDLTLSSLALSNGSLSPAFAAGTRDYAVTVESNVSSITVTPTLNTGTGVASLTVNGVAATSGSASTVNLEYGPNVIPITIAASDTAGTTNTYNLTVTRTPTCEISIDTQPAASTTVTAGSISGSLSTSATVTNSGTPVYNWYACDSTGTISGNSLGTGASFTIPMGLAARTYYYLCRVTADGAVPVNSSVATVTVQAAPTAAIADVTVSGTVGNVITPVDVIITLQGATFNALAAGSVGWFTNMPAGLAARIKTDVAQGATTATITISGTPTAASSAAMSITIPAGRLASGANALTVANNPNAKWNITDPANATVTPTSASYDKSTGTGGLAFTLSPGSYTLTAIKNGNATLTSGTDYTVSGNVYTIAHSYLAAQPTGSLTLTFDMSGGADPTATVTITDGTPVPPTPSAPVITSPATNQTVRVVVGNTATMTVTATDAAAYQWQIDRNDGNGWQDISGATSASYTSSPVTLNNDGYRYRCVASNAYGSATSPVFTLSVIEQPDIPVTGDNAQPGLWLGIMLIAGAGLAGSIALSRRKRKTEN